MVEIFHAGDATTLSAARARLASTAQQCRMRRALTNEEYYGGGRRDEPVQQVAGGDVLDAVITRNHYGSLVLNAAHALFIDVDMLEAGRIDISTQEHCDHRQASWKRMLDDIRIVLASETNDGFRIYRTAAGFRILATAREFEPDSRDSKRLMDTAGADAAFVELCRIQNCFRARLTPKPWRCGTKRPPSMFPRELVTETHRFTEWLSQYERACSNHATCQYLGQVGATRTHERIAPIVEFHDRETRALEPLPLA